MERGGNINISNKCLFIFFRWLTLLGMGAYIDNFHELGLTSMHHLDDFSLDVSNIIFLYLSFCCSSLRMN